eukprot:CAMPEP_0205935734 /NCGR_PEP_ID=MMETSP1325-20131115/39746_1 /ASSEMBLY_ACC=CAM_ASM_000708 /TAXON_ID=236786 /ORGANISM="Florenciella sp., Strain RCC1007" /LENGTH=40 /DNA_ID= /DNA_START= /DNA_END= /DNA_ORIENTATION=
MIVSVFKGKKRAVLDADEVQPSPAADQRPIKPKAEGPENV